jgi:hypothetical protein
MGIVKISSQFCTGEGGRLPLILNVKRKKHLNLFTIKECFKYELLLGCKRLALNVYIRVPTPERVFKS